MTSKDDRPSSSQQPESPASHALSRGRHSLSESEGRSSSHESGRDPILYESQSSNVSETPTIRSGIRPIGNGEGEIESEAQTSTDVQGSQESVTLQPYGPDVRILTPPSTPTSPTSPPHLTSEITPESPSSSSTSSITISIPESPPLTTSSPSSKKRRKFWSNLKRGGGNLRKRLCCCLSPKAANPEKEPSVLRPRPEIELTGGTLRSHVSMDSLTARQVADVIMEHGSAIVLKGERLEAYQQKMEMMLRTYFDRQAGNEILRLWKLDASRPSRLYAEMLPTENREPRYLTLGDVRLVNQRDNTLDRRDDSLLRYFMSYEGLHGRMLIPGRG